MTDTVRRALLLGFTALTLAFVAGCATPTAAPATIAQTAANTSELSTLNKLIADAGLTDTLNGTGPYTVFAPTNDAFKAVPAKTMAELASNKERLKAVLTYHVVAGKVMAAQARTGKLKSVQGTDLGVGVAGGFVTIDEALVTQADVPASNGVVHLIDKVLLPPASK